MKQNTSHSKVIIHHLGGPSMVAPRRSSTTVWLRLLGLTMLVFAAGSLQAGTHKWSDSGANPAPASAVLITTAPR